MQVGRLTTLVHCSTIMRRSARVKKIGNAAKKDAVCDIEEAVGEHAFSYHDFDDDEFAKFRSQLLAWFQRHRRRLPWRGDTPPFTTEEQTRQRSTDSEVGCLLAFVNVAQSSQYFRFIFFISSNLCDIG